MVDFRLMPTNLTYVAEDIYDIEQLFDAYKMNIPTYPFVINGVKDIDENMFVNKLKHIAQKKEVFFRRIKVEKQNDFIEARDLDEYREKCKNEAFTLFSKWFHSLWY